MAMVFLTCARCIRFASSSPVLRRVSSLSKMKPVSLTSYRGMFYEPGLKPDEKYDGLRKAFDELDYNEQLKIGFKAFLKECNKLREENRELFTRDIYIADFEPDELTKMWDFRDEETFKSWQTACDQDWDEGFSSVNWTRSKSGCALFSGHLDSKTMPRDGTVERVGWANVTCPEKRKSFGRDDRYDLEGYTHLVMRVRGDGRKYGVIIRCRGHFDITWYDIYSYGLYTTGGPYWQFVKIPFSKFFLNYKGAIQDNQDWPPLFNISTVGITLMDRYTGPYNLEIDYIGVVNDPIHEERCAYEHYYVPDSPYRIGET